MALTTYDWIAKENQEIGEERGKKIGREEGKEETQTIVIEKIILKFPDWSDHQIAEFMEVDESLVAQIRANLK